MPNPIISIARQQKDELANRNQQLTATLTRAYLASLQSLDTQIESLNVEILRLTQNGETISSSKLFHLSRYTSLQKQIIEEVQRLTSFADLTVRSEIPDLVTLGVNDSFILVRDQFQSLQGRQALVTAWDNLNIDQIEAANSLLTNNSPFNSEYSNALGESVADRIEQELIKAVVIGNNPRLTAQIIRQELGLSLARTLNTARTAQIYSYRTATHFNYQNNADIVKSWIWYSSLDPRTCTSCWAKHGTEYSLNYMLNDHHQGRCTAIPQIRNAEKYGLRNLDVEDGETIFNRLSNTQQIEIMGPTRLEHYRRNDFNFSDMSRPYENNIYGTMVRESTIGELLHGQ